MKIKNISLLVIIILVVVGFIVYESSNEAIAPTNEIVVTDSELNNEMMNEIENSDTVDVVIDPSLTANQWQWQTTEYSDDTVIIPENSGDFIASFSDEGQFSSSTDCNQTFGSYSIGEDNALIFVPLASTLMFCENSQETEYGNMLSEISSYMIADNGNLVLMIKYDSGSMIFSPISNS